MRNTSRSLTIAATFAACVLALSACASGEVPAAEITPSATTETAEASEATAELQEFTADVWADNWFEMYVNGELVGEDSVPITTERSFNKETFTFTASYPLTIAIEAKDFKETDSGIEYIGLANQQMGDGGLIAQVTDASGSVVAATDGSWESLVIQRAPLDTSCENAADPDTACTFEVTDVADDWFATDFDSSSWTSAGVFSAAEVSPKDGYDEVSWDSSAELIWGTSLTQDNTILFRTVADAP
ncbi:hypothetical protein [Salinibacterium sp. NK8237]|uniref:hypothetical protein n=1 Tax=Salinibacterium sp. NK8237 TaxID=2792038 RepID=UPI0018CE3069|nr:hypothetical protein [Salinibacterium sp. NK8237]MBH0130085.1 hypothetical protein [Salinibacterium sp. NK8237]